MADAGGKEGINDPPNGGEESRIPTLESYLSDLKGKGTQSKFFKKSLWQRGRPESLRPIKDSERV